MDIVYIKMKLHLMTNKLHIFPPRFRLISLDFLDDILLSSFCNVNFMWYLNTTTISSVYHFRSDFSQ